MNFKHWLISEMPITGFTKVGDFSPTAKRLYGFSKQDAGILNNPKAVEKIHKKWSNTKENFDFYFVRQPKAYKQFAIGEVSAEWVKDKLNLDVQPNEDSITVIFTNNIGDQGVPMTAFIIAHRLGHAIRNDRIFDYYLAQEIEKDFKGLLKNIYNYSGDSYWDFDNNLKALVYAVATMRSARQRNLRNFAEFTHEILAQYIITGKVKFNPIPKFLLVKNHMAWGNPVKQGLNSRLDDEKMAEWNEVLQGYADKYEHYIDSVLMGLVGKIFVM